eukprot:604601-Rhodomonas_salina.1
MSGTDIAYRAPGMVLPGASGGRVDRPRTGSGFEEQLEGLRRRLPISLRAPYAMSGTDLAYVLSPYALGTQCPRIVLPGHVRSAVRAAGRRAPVGHPIVLRAGYAMSGY